MIIYLISDRQNVGSAVGEIKYKDLSSYRPNKSSGSFV